MDDQAMRTYLGDHLLGARAVTEVVQRRIDRGDGPDYLTTFLTELEQERGIVEDLLDEFGGSSLPKQAVGWVAEKLGQVKLQLDAVIDGDLRDLLELELFRTGVEGKGCLYRSLRALTADPRIAAVDVDALVDLAARQAEELERHRLAAALAALT
jgi:hypothetical protein